MHNGSPSDVSEVSGQKPRCHVQIEKICLHMLQQLETYVLPCCRFCDSSISTRHRIPMESRQPPQVWHKCNVVANSYIP